MSDYRKIVDSKNIVYYIKKEIIETLNGNFFQTDYKLLLHSDFAINRNTNELIKCRLSIEELIDIYTGNN